MEITVDIPGPRRTDGFEPVEIERHGEHTTAPCEDQIVVGELSRPSLDDRVASGGLKYQGRFVFTPVLRNSFLELMPMSLPR